ncbi:hypothetical protein EYF80_006003 [Liparis tanakae]|uniref:Uncharacterized protein n=1 Tax=Liparis tanakae TaxID=230148 RepID=A0A4Z2J1B8_9TELE|nr:hypothetical protein EYF80_006003 [Liparis tanakae]
MDNMKVRPRLGFVSVSRFKHGMLIVSHLELCGLSKSYRRNTFCGQLLAAGWPSQASPDPDRDLTPGQAPGRGTTDTHTETYALTSTYMYRTVNLHRTTRRFLRQLPF